MKRSPKAIGTAYATSVARWLQDAGWPDADRLPQYGSQDRGDLTICRMPAVVAECKAGTAADTASAAVIEQWMEEAERERLHASAIICPLIVYRRRRSIANHDVWLPLWAVVDLDSGVRGGSEVPVRMSLADFSDLLLEWVSHR